MRFVFADADGEQREWQPAPDDIARWRSRFTGLDVEKQLESLAAWTWDKWGQKSKRRKLNNAIPWVTKMLERAQDKNEGFSHASRAREALAKPEWERRGMTQEQWEAEQRQIWADKQQAKMDLTPPPEPVAIETLAMLKELTASLPVPAEVEMWKPPSVHDQMRCQHRWTQFSPRQCWDCYIFEHQAWANFEAIG